MASIQSQSALADPVTDRAAQPRKALIVVDGSERTGRVVAHALNLAQSQAGAEVVLLAIVRRPPDERLRGQGAVRREAIQAHLREVVGERAVNAVARQLDQAGIPHKDRVEVGDPADTILRVAAEEGCDLIVVAGAPAGMMHHWLPRVIGLSPATVAVQVAQRAVIPVTVIH